MYITRGLLDGLLAYATSEDPQPVQASLGAIPAKEFADTTDLDPETPVLAHFYLPTTDASVSAVFGFDLGAPPGTVDARFISHPGGELDVLTSDDLHATMLIAVPPWDNESVACFDRHGTRGQLEVLDIEVPAESID